jgi:Protein of unknown function (DUF1566)
MNEVWALGLCALLGACKLDFTAQQRAADGGDSADAALDAGTDEPDARADAAADELDAEQTPLDDAGSQPLDALVEDAGPPTCSAAQIERCGDDFPCLASSAGYTCRGQFPDWPVVTRTSAVDGFVVDAAANSVLDLTTGLEWVRSTGDIVRSYAEAVAYCEARGPGQHVPTVAEFSSLLNTPTVPDVDPDVFPGGDGPPYWTSIPANPQPAGADFPWMFGLGLVNGVFDIVPYAPSDLLRVACVRVAEPRFSASPEERLVVEPDVVHDLNTGLYWLRAGLEDDVPYADAAAWCADKQFGGRDWRVPTMAEMLSLADPTREFMTPSDEVYQGWIRDVHWTSDVPVGGEGSHYALNFGWYDARFDVRVTFDVDDPRGVCCPVRCVSSP